MKGASLNTFLNSASTGRPCFLMVDMNPRVRQKYSAPSSLRNVLEILCFSFIMRRSRSAWLLVKGMAKPFMNARISSWYLRHRSRDSRIGRGRYHPCRIGVQDYSHTPFSERSVRLSTHSAQALHNPGFGRYYAKSFAYCLCSPGL